jgi:hypothetical protein
MAWLTDPKLFNYVILALYTLSSMRHFAARDVGQGCYWLSAFAITATVTFLMEGK